MGSATTTLIPVYRYDQISAKAGALQHYSIPSGLQASATDVTHADILQTVDLPAVKLLRNVSIGAMSLFLGQIAHDPGIEHSWSVVERVDLLPSFKLLTKQRRQYRIADFHDPVTLTWSRERNNVRQAVRKFIE